MPPAQKALPDFLVEGGKPGLPPVAPPPGLPPTPGPPGEPVFLLNRLLKKFARTPSLVAPALKQTNNVLEQIPFSHIITNYLDFHLLTHKVIARIGF